MIEEVDAEGFNDHVHSWWELVLEPSRLDDHLNQLRDGRRLHPSGSFLVDVFLDHARRQRDAGHGGNAKALEDCAVRVADVLQWDVEKAQKELSQDAWRELSKLKGWEGRYFMRAWKGEEGGREDAMKAVERGEGEAGERARVLYIAGRGEEAKKQGGKQWQKAMGKNVKKKEPPKKKGRRRVGVVEGEGVSVGGGGDVVWGDLEKDLERRAAHEDGGDGQRALQALWSAQVGALQGEQQQANKLRKILRIE